MKLDRNFYLVLISTAIVAFAISVFAGAFKAEATYVPKVDICHYDGQSGNYQTLHIAAIAAAIHLNQHEDDYSGACEEVIPTPTEEVTPTITPTVVPCDEAPSELVLVEGVPCSTEEPTVTPEATPSDEKFDIHGDGRSDGRSDGLCSQTPCVTPGYVDPNGTVLLPIGSSPK